MALSLALFALCSHASGIRNNQAEAEVGNHGVAISARYTISLTPVQEEALRSGLSLPFTYEFKMTKPRLYSWYRSVMDGFSPNATLTYRLSYQPLTRQFRTNTSGITRTFTSLEEALTAIGIIRDWSVLEGSDLAPEDFAGRIKLRLDVSLLPKAYQLTSIGNADWQLESDWTNLQAVRPEGSQ